MLHRSRRALAALFAALVATLTLAMCSPATDPPPARPVPPASSTTTTSTTCPGCDPVAPHGPEEEQAIGPQRALAAVGGGLSTSTLRLAWGPACRPKGNVYLAAYAALDRVLADFHYEARARDTGAYSCRRITGGTGYSLHSYGPGDRFRFWCCTTIATSLAVDINWTSNPYGRVLRTDMPSAMVARIEAIRTNNGKQLWRWGGRYTVNKDAMHFEIVVTPADLATGIRPEATEPSHVWSIIRPGADDRVRGGHDVAEVQWILRILGHDEVAIDGIYGPETEAAVSAFKSDIIAMQLGAGLPRWPNTDGIVGPATIAMLRWWAAAA